MQLAAQSSISTSFLYFTLFFSLVLWLPIGFASESFAMGDSTIKSEEVPRNSKKRKRSSPILHNTTLVRVDEKDFLLAQYAQRLICEDKANKLVNLNRKSSKASIKYVWTASVMGNYKSHLLAQGISRTNNDTRANPFTTDLEFPNILRDPRLEVDWISKLSKAKPYKEGYKCRRSEQEDGHSEPQFIEDFDAVFKTRPAGLVDLLLPPAGNEDPVYMCGVELFAPFDMCEPCLDKLIQFRKAHQKGQLSISQFLRDKLKDRFKASDENAFVVIYHAERPYQYAGTYTAEDEDSYYPLSYNMGPVPHFAPKHKYRKYFDENFTFSQSKRTIVQPNIIYGYIHYLSNTVAPYKLFDESVNFFLDLGKQFIFPEIIQEE